MQRTTNIVVLGSNGMTGRRLVPRLLERGATNVRATRRTGDPSRVFVWEDPSTHAAAFAGMTAAYLVPPALVAHPATLVAPALVAARDAGVTRVVLCSSLGVELSPGPLRDGWRELERIIVESRLAWTILRPGGFAQNFTEGFLAPGVRSGAVSSAAGQGATAFIDAADIAEVAATALLDDGHASKTYALTGPTALTMRDALAIVDPKVAYRPIGADDMTTMLIGFGIPRDYAEMVVADQLAIAEGRATAITDDVERVLGRPAASFEKATATATAR